MKFICEGERFVQAVNIVSKALPSKPSTPILAGIQITAQDDLLEIRAGDNETDIIAKLTPADGLEILSPGKAVFVGRYLMEMIRNLPGETITIEHNGNDNQAQIKSGNLKYTLLSMSGELPQLEVMKSDAEFTVSDKALRNLILKTQYACSTDTARPIFTGCVLQTNGKTLTMAATNTHQLAVQNTELNTECETNITVTIPGKVLANVEKSLLSGVPSDVHIKVNNKKINFDYESGNLQINTRLIEGKFPDYRRVIPLDFKTRVTIRKEDFASSLRRISVISNTSEYKSCKFEFSNNSIRISANNPDIGYSEEIIPAVVDGDDLTISFNSDYLMRVMGVLEGSEFIFSLNTTLSAAAIREMDSSGFTYIITPIRTVN